MSISFSGLASGLDTASWVEALVSIKQEKVTELQTELQAIQATKNTLSSTKTAFSSLRSALEKLTDNKFGGAFDLFGKNTATSSDENVFTATATSDAARQNYDIIVNQLATFTKVSSLNSASAVADDNTELSKLGITKGSFSVYVDGVKTAVEIEEGDTLGDLKSQLAAAGVQTEVDENGVLTFSAYEEGKTINIGATTDSSNLVSFVGLTKQEDGTYISTNSLFKASVMSKLTSEDSGFNKQITAGTFTIGDAVFSIDETTTLSSLISKINSNEDAQASAFWDDATGKLIITSKKEGASYVNIEAGTSNFTDVMGFTETVRDENGVVTSSKMLTEAQELGKNALFSINGTEMTSTSNTITSDISRISGVTLNLKKTSADEEGNIKASTLKVNQDTSGLVDAVKGFIEAYNAVITKIDDVTATGAEFSGDSSLKSFKNTLRTYANSSSNNGESVYKLLSEIGISTGEADASNLSTDTNKLVLDEKKLLKALEENPESVEALLTGENGVLTKMEDTVEMTLKSTVGFFDIKNNSINSDISKMKNKISKQTEKVSTYRAQLEKKFSNMELVISQMQQNYSSFLG